MDLFNLTKILFENPSEYNEVSKVDKRTNFFMINRRMSINFPLQASVLNHIRINKESTIDVWQRFLGKKYNKTPFWMFIKGIKKAKEDKEKKLDVTSSLMEEYAKKHRLDLKSVKEAIHFFPSEMKQELKEFEKLNK